MSLFVMQHVITSCLQKNCSGAFACLSRYTCLKSFFVTKTYSASSLSTLKSFKVLSFSLYGNTEMKYSGKEKRKVKKQGAILLMTVRESVEEVSSSALRDSSKCPLCIGLWQILISSSAQPPNSTIHTGEHWEPDINGVSD